MNISQPPFFQRRLIMFGCARYIDARLEFPHGCRYGSKAV